MGSPDVYSNKDLSGYETIMVNKTLASILAQIEPEQTSYIEPGLLRIFRMLTCFQLAVALIILLVIKILEPDLNLAPFVLWTAGWLVPLMIYLSWPLAQRKLGPWYLPIALFVMTAFSLAPRLIRIYTGPVDLLPIMTDLEIISSGWRLLLVLIVPLVFIAWQYRFQYVVFYSLAITIINLVTGALFTEKSNPLWTDIVDQSLSGGVIFMIIGYVINQLVLSQHEKQQALADANVQLIDFASTAEQLATSRERNRLARDLHDTLAHTLSSITVQLEAVDSVMEHSPERAREVLGKTLANARGGLGETRRALRALRASPLDDLGLALALRTLAETTAARTQMKLTVDIPNEVTLAPELEQNIYRIAQESIENTVQHANAKNFSVSLRKQDGMTLLEIKDDGQGFHSDNYQSDGHYGLQGLRERAELIGAQLKLESQLGAGTTVRLALKQD